MEVDRDLELDEDGDLVLKDGDFVLIQDVDCLIQDIKNALTTNHYEWAGDFVFGSRLYQQVNHPREELALGDIQDAVVEVLRRDDRVVEDSWEVGISDEGIKVTFLPTSRERPVEVTIR